MNIAQITTTASSNTEVKDYLRKLVLEKLKELGQEKEDAKNKNRYIPSRSIKYVADLIGINKNTLSNICSTKSKYNPSIEIVLKILQYFGKEIQFIDIEKKSSLTC